MGTQGQETKTYYQLIRELEQSWRNFCLEFCYVVGML